VGAGAAAETKRGQGALAAADAGPGAAFGACVSGAATGGAATGGAATGGAAATAGYGAWGLIAQWHPELAAAAAVAIPGPSRGAAATAGGSSACADRGGSGAARAERKSPVHDAPSAAVAAACHAHPYPGGVQAGPPAHKRSCLFSDSDSE
jgi:hypothetical protein